MAARADRRCRAVSPWFSCVCAWAIIAVCDACLCAPLVVCRDAEALANLFPVLPPRAVVDVLALHGGDMARAIEALLAVGSP